MHRCYQKLHQCWSSQLNQGSTSKLTFSVGIGLWTWFGEWVNHVKLTGLIFQNWVENFLSNLPNIMHHNGCTYTLCHPGSTVLVTGDRNSVHFSVLSLIVLLRYSPPKALSIWGELSSITGAFFNGEVIPRLNSHGSPLHLWKTIRNFHQYNRTWNSCQLTNRLESGKHGESGRWIFLARHQNTFLQLSYTREALTCTDLFPGYFKVNLTSLGGKKEDLCLTT